MESSERYNSVPGQIPSSTERISSVEIFWIVISSATSVKKFV